MPVYDLSASARSLAARFLTDLLRPRRRFLKSFGAAFALAFVTGLALASPAQAESNGGVRVMPLGDSITDGANVPGGYRINLCQLMPAGGYTVDFVGSGFNSRTRRSRP